MAVLFSEENPLDGTFFGAIVADIFCGVAINNEEAKVILLPPKGLTQSNRKLTYIALLLLL